MVPYEHGMGLQLEIRSHVAIIWLILVVTAPL